MKIEIIKTDGKWLVNGKPYPQLSYSEKVFFDEFLIAMKISFEAEKQEKKQSHE